MREKQQEQAGRENREIPFDGGRLVWNYGENRLQILFDGKPDEQTRTLLKKTAFKWAPSHQAWQRQLTLAAESAARHVLRIDF
ncbi:hypothetical protein NXY33_08865 [Bacteroides fragilis]|nr:hypothetical protein [Bacteroides fragilis]